VNGEERPPYGRVIEIPSLRKGQRVVAAEIKITEVEGKYGPQYQIDGVLEDYGNYKARAWVKKYDDPTLNAKMCKLAALADRRTGEWSASAHHGFMKLAQIGRVYFEVSGFREEEPKYPRFVVVDDELPPNRVDQKPLGEPGLSSEARVWLRYNRGFIGEKLPPAVYNYMAPSVREELAELGLLTDADGYPMLSGEAARFVE